MESFKGVVLRNCRMEHIPERKGAGNISVILVTFAHLRAGLLEPMSVEVWEACRNRGKISLESG